jgi:hypothetical protein
MSAALCVFSGCSFAQPSGLAPFVKNSLCPKSRYTAKKRRLLFIFSPPFHAAIPSLHFAKKLRFVLGLAWLFDCRNTATSLLKKNNFRRKSYNYFFLRCLGVFDCLSYLTTYFLKTTKEKIQ